MAHATKPIPDNRELTVEERSLISWMLQNGNPDASPYIAQLDVACVFSRCPCGCASIDLSVDGRRPKDFRMHVLGEYQWKDKSGNLFGAFVFEQDGLLAGLDLWSIDGAETPHTLPNSMELMPYG